MKATAKTVGGRILRTTGWLRRGLVRTGVIVAFHRVNARSAGDPLTRSPKDYRSFCRFFKSDFDVVPLADMVARLEARRSVEGLLAITHDDGYLDNRAEAAPILAELGLPATFFVATGFVDSDIVPDWDRAMNARHPWMSWEHVRELHRMGFSIGSHTHSHRDLGQIGADEAEGELAHSREQLASELGELPDLFAFPFGGANHITPANRELVRKAGYRTCLSCHGGVVRDGADPFDLARVPISSWYANPDQLALELGLRRA